MKIGIVGGGPTGLAAGYKLARNGHKVVVFEREESCGGLTGTVTVGDQELEKFYHHIFTSDEAVINLLEDLHLSEALFWKTPVSGLHTGNRLYPFTSPLDLLRFNELSPAARVALGLLVFRARMVKDWHTMEKITAREWVIKKAGAGVYEKVWGPLLSAKFDRDADRISAVWLWNKFKLRGSTRDKVTGPEKFGYLQGSFGLLYNKLAARIKQTGGQVHCLQEVKRIIPQNDGSLLVETPAGRERFARVIVTAAPEIMLNMVDGFPAEYVSRLKKIQYKANLCLMLELSRPLSPYYWISVTDPCSPFVAVIEHTNLVPAADYGAHIVYLSRYLDADDELYRAPDDRVIKIFTEYLKKLFPSWNKASLKRTRLYRARYAQPVVVTGYGEIVPGYETPIDHLYLACMAQIYPEDRGQNYSIKTGLEIAAIAGKSEGREKSV